MFLWSIIFLTRSWAPFHVFSAKTSEQNKEKSSESKVSVQACVRCCCRARWAKMLRAGGQAASFTSKAYHLPWQQFSSYQGHSFEKRLKQCSNFKKQSTFKWECIHRIPTFPPAIIHPVNKQKNKNIISILLGEAEHECHPLTFLKSPTVVQLIRYVSAPASHPVFFLFVVFNCHTTIEWFSQDHLSSFPFLFTNHLFVFYT